MRVQTDNGEVIELGETEAAPTIGIVDYSRRVTDDFGVTTVVERGFSRRMSVRLAVPFGDVDALQRRLADLRATPALWVADDRFDWLSARGFYKDFALDLAVPPLSLCTLTVEGLAQTEVVADGGGDPAPAGQLSTLQVLQPVTVVGAVLASSSVAEADYAEWTAGTTYPLGARVIKAATHRIYESSAAGNIGDDPAGASGKWADVGPTNRWAMFDQALGSATVADGSIDVILNVACNAVALLDVIGSTVVVQAAGYVRQTPVAAGATTFLDLPSDTAQVQITIYGTGPVSVGTLLVGRLVALGITEASPTAGIADYSRKEVDDFGEVSVVQRAWAKRMTARALIRTDAVDLVANRIAAVRARPSLWIGQADLDSLTIYGFFKDFSIEVGESVSKLSLSIEGLSTAGKVEPISSSVTWPDVADPVGTKPTDNADVTGDNTSKDTAAVGGRPTGSVLIQIDQAVADIDALIEQVANLDAGEAGSALLQAAQAARDAAIAAKANSEIARDQSQAARDASNAAAALAEQLALAAAVSKGDAAGFATTASGSATIATQKADEAGQQAVIATAKADIASTRAGEASIASQAAAISESNAAGSAQSAVVSSSVAANAKSAAQALLDSQFPPVLNPIGRVGYECSQPFVFIGPNGGWPTPYLIATDNAFHYTAMEFRHRAMIARVVGRRFRVETYVFSYNANARFYIGLHDFSTSDGAAIRYVGSADLPSASGGVTSITPPGPAFHLLAAEFVMDAAWQSFIRPFISVVSSDDQPIVEVVHIGGIRITDVTDGHAALISAQASSESASSAAASDNAAGQKASAADSSAQVAVTRAGEASVHRDAAALSEQNAAGSVVQASNLVQLAAASEADAAEHAEAAVITAQTATTRATEAGISATAADQSKLDAQAASGSALAQAGVATERAAFATGEAAAATESRNLAASYRDDAAAARDGAAAARDASQASAGVAQSASAAADGHRATAETASNLSAQYRNEAQGFRDGAAQQVVDAQALVGQEASVRAGETGALAQRLDTTEASVGGLSARATTVETAVTDGRFAAVSRVETLETEYNGTKATVTQQAGTLYDVNYRTRAYWRSEAVAGDGTASIALYADSNGGGAVEIVGNLRVRGDLLVDGTLRTEKIAENAVSAMVGAQNLSVFAINYSDFTTYYGTSITVANPSGGPIRVDFRYALGFGGPGSASLGVQIQRIAADGTTTNFNDPSSSGGIILDYPPAGASVTYRFQFKHNSGGGSGQTSVIYQQIFALQMKR